MAVFAPSYLGSTQVYTKGFLNHIGAADTNDSQTLLASSTSNRIIQKMVMTWNAISERETVIGALGNRSYVGFVFAIVPDATLSTDNWAVAPAVDTPTLGFEMYTLTDGTILEARFLETNRMRRTDAGTEHAINSYQDVPGESFQFLLPAPIILYAGYKVVLYSQLYLPNNDVPGVYIRGIFCVEIITQ